MTGSALRRALALPAATKLRAAEAALALALARIATCLPARVYAPALGRGPEAPGTAEAAPTPPETLARARAIGGVTEAVARRLPGVHCLETAIACRLMLRLRRIPARVVLGVSREPLAAPERGPERGEGRAAHAWVLVGGSVVAGGTALDHYAPVAEFG